jgi:lytic murein transglycosylase
MLRRHLILLAGGLWAPAAWGQTLSPSMALGVKGEAYFTEWFDQFYPRALAAGLPRTLVDRELAGLSPDPRVAVLDAKQPEFARPVGDYIRGVSSNDRIALGRAKRAALSFWPQIESEFGVPRDILLGIWAMESGFGAQQGDMDVIACLATLAALGRRRAWAEGEVIAALRILAEGQIPRSRLKGSWAGAMGQTQFLPSIYLSTAVDGDHDGKRDIWGSPADALASAANLLARAGWRREQSWAVEVSLPARFDYGLSESAKEPFADWAARGVRRADGRPWRAQDAAAPAVLLLPSGWSGPAFLALPNHFAIRAYNNSIAYALAVGILADRFGGGPGVLAPWPKEATLTLDQRLAAQHALSKLGFSPGLADGAFGALSRQALRAWQASVGLPADGYLSPEIVDRLRVSAR